MDFQNDEHFKVKTMPKYSLMNRLSSSTVLSDSNPCAEVSGYLKIIQDVYSRQLAAIENNQNLSESQKAKQKILALESYVKHLYEQNDTFSSTMASLERECDHRVKEMEKRLKKSAKTTMEAAINMHEYEKETKRLVEERMYIESLYKEVKHHLAALKVENSFLRDHNSNLIHDVHALLHLIHHARSTGHWELDCVTFCEVTPEQVFGPIQSISHSYGAEASNTGSQLFSKNSRKEKANFSPVHHYSSYLPKCASLPEIGNIYNISQAVHKSNSYDTNDIKRLLGVKLYKRKITVAENTVQTPELLKDVSCVKNLEERLCNRKSQSEPHLFMFDGNIYKYTPCEPNKKPSSNALNENYQSSLPPYQSIDLKFPTEGSTLKVNVWNNLKSGSYLDDQENSYLKDNSDSSCSEADLSELNYQMYQLLRQQARDQNKQASRLSVGLQAETDRTTRGTQFLSEDFETHVQYIDNHVKDELSVIQGLKEDLNKAMIHEERKSILLGELQNHVNSAFAQVEQKSKVIENIERKLKSSRDECKAFQEEVSDLNLQVATVTRKYKDSCTEIISLRTQVEQQSSLIRNLQDALVQNKRALEVGQAIAMKHSEGVNENKRKKSNIIDI